VGKGPLLRLWRGRAGEGCKLSPKTSASTTDCGIEEAIQGGSKHYDRGRVPAIQSKKENGLRQI